MDARTHARTHGYRAFYNLPYQAYRPAGDNKGTGIAYGDLHLIFASLMLHSLAHLELACSCLLPVTQVFFYIITGYEPPLYQSWIAERMQHESATHWEASIVVYHK